METDNEIYFYGKSNDYGCLSNFYTVNFVDENKITYNSTEQYFMYQKCLTFDPNNKVLLKVILETTSPTAAKAFGRQVKNYDDVIWNNLRYQKMLNGLRLKFTQNNEIKQILLKTKNKTLYEASPRDKIWGIGCGAKTAITKNKELFGQNLLGKALMEVRSELMK